MVQKKVLEILGKMKRESKFCVWKYYKHLDYDDSLGHHYIQCNDIRVYSDTWDVLVNCIFCPYCGRRIKEK